MQKTHLHILFSSLLITVLVAACSSTPQKETIVIDSPSKQEQADIHFALGEAHAMEGHRKEAIEEFRSALIYDNHSITIRLRLVTEYVRANLVDQALSEVSDVIQENAGSVDAYVLRGGIYASAQKFPEARADYEKVIQLDAKRPEGYLYLGAIAAEIPDDTLAEKSFLKLTTLETYSTPHLAWYYLGKIYIDQPGVQPKMKALHAFEKAQSLKPTDEDSAVAISKTEIALGHKDLALKKIVHFSKTESCDPKTYLFIGELALDQNEPALAEDAFSRIQDDPELGLSAKLKLAGIYLSQKNLDHGLQLLEELAEKIPDSDRIQYFLGTTYENRGHAERAIAFYEKIDSSSSFYGDSIVHTTYLLRAKNLLDEAIHLAADALAKRKDLPQLYALYSQLLEASGDHEKSLLVIEAGIDTHPNNSQLEFFGALAYEKNDRLDDGIQLMNQLVAREPNHVQALNFLAFAYAEKGVQLPEAQKLIQRALKLQPNDAYLLDTLGWVEFKQGKLDDAIITLEKAHAKEPDEPVISGHLGDVYAKSSLPLKARAMYESAAGDRASQRLPASAEVSP